MNVLKETTKVSYFKLLYQDIQIALLRALVWIAKFIATLIIVFGGAAIIFSAIGIPAFYLMNIGDGFSIENDEDPIKYDGLRDYYQKNEFLSAQNFLIGMGFALSILVGFLSLVIHGLVKLVGKIRDYIRDLIQRAEEYHE